MTDQQTLDDIKSLLVELPGISSAVAYYSTAGDSVWIRFRCCDFDSLKSVLRVAEASNVSISIGSVDGRACGEEKIDPNLAFDMTISEIHDEEFPTTTQIFGLYLARTLQARGVQNHAAADRLRVAIDGPLD